MKRIQKKGQLSIGLILGVLAAVIGIVFLTAVIPTIAANTNASVGSLTSYDSTAGTLLSSVGYLLIGMAPIGLLIGLAVMGFKGKGK